MLNLWERANDVPDTWEHLAGFCGLVMGKKIGVRFSGHLYSHLMENMTQQEQTNTVSCCMREKRQSEWKGQMDLAQEWWQALSLRAFWGCREVLASLSNFLGFPSSWRNLGSLIGECGHGLSRDWILVADLFVVHGTMDGCICIIHFSGWIRAGSVKTSQGLNKPLVYQWPLPETKVQAVLGRKRILRCLECVAGFYRKSMARCAGFALTHTWACTLRAQRNFLRTCHPKQIGTRFSGHVNSRLSQYTMQ